MPTVSRARIHVKTIVPPGKSLIGILPLNLIRLEKVKLTLNAHLVLFSPRGPAIAFDGLVHDLTSDHGTTLCFGNHLSVLVENRSSEPTEAELQLSGSCVDGPEPEPGEKLLPVLAHQEVVGLVAQEAVVERFGVRDVPLEELDHALEHHVAKAELAWQRAFNAACLDPTALKLSLLDDAEHHRDRVHGLQLRVRHDLKARPETIQNYLGFTDEQWRGLRDTLKTRHGFDDGELDRHLATVASDPSARRMFASNIQRSEGLTLAEEHEW